MSATEHRRNIEANEQKIRKWPEQKEMKQRNKGTQRKIKREKWKKCVGMSHRTENIEAKEHKLRK